MTNLALPIPFTAPHLPLCPLCDAPPIPGYKYERWDDIEHECDCVRNERALEYGRALPILWRSRNALPHYLATLPARYHDYTAANITPTPENKPVMAALKAGLTGNLYLYGEAGTGKTHLAAAGARRLAERGRSARFWGMAALIQELRAAASGDQARPELSHWDVLILDDIDKIRPTPFVYEVLYALIEERWANRKITVFTAQHDPNEAAVILTPEGNERAADPLASRMGSGQVFKVTGRDWRAS